jgi:hypothetical protein
LPSNGLANGETQSGAPAPAGDGRNFQPLLSRDRHFRAFCRLNVQRCTASDPAPEIQRQISNVRHPRHFRLSNVNGFFASSVVRIRKLPANSSNIWRAVRYRTGTQRRDANIGKAGKTYEETGIKIIAHQGKVDRLQMISLTGSQRPSITASSTPLRAVGQDGVDAAGFVAKQRPRS